MSEITLTIPNGYELQNRLETDIDHEFRTSFSVFVVLQDEEWVKFEAKLAKNGLKYPKSHIMHQKLNYPIPDGYELLNILETDIGT